MQRGVEMRRPAHDRVRVDEHGLLRRDRDDQWIAVADETELPLPGEDAVEQSAAGHAGALHGLDLVRQRGVETEHVAAVDGEHVTRLDVDDETVLCLVREPGLALTAHRHQRQPLPGDRALEHAAHALALAFELQVPPVGDHRALPREHLAVDGVLDGLGVLHAHPGRVRRLDHVLVGEKIALHTGMLSRTDRFRQATRAVTELRRLTRSRPEW